MKTGKHSLLNLIHGYFRSLHEQSKSDWSFDEIKELMKMLSIENNWPCKTLKRVVGGKLKYYKVPRSVAGRSDEELMIISKTVEAFADENNFWLIYYDENDKPYRSVQGRTKKEMIKYIEELERCGEFEEARILKQPVKNE